MDSGIKLMSSSLMANNDPLNHLVSLDVTLIILLAMWEADIFLCIGKNVASVAADEYKLC